jgi:hypothetical protein
MYFDNHSPSMLTWLIDPCLDPIAQDQIYGNIYLQLLIFSLKTVFGDDEWMKSDEKIASLNNAASSTLAGSIRWWPCEGCIQYSGWQYSMMAMWRVHPVLWLAVFDDGHVKGASSTLAGSIRWWPCEGDRPESWSNHNNATCLGSRLQYRNEW